MKLYMKDLKVGMTVKMANNSFNYCGYKKGDIVVISNFQNNFVIINFLNSRRQISVGLDDIESNITIKSEIEDKIKNLQSEIDIEKDKLTWMKATKNDIYDEVEYKVWTVLQTLNSKSSDADKAKVIAELIKG